MSGAINFKVDRCPSDELSLQNVAVVNPADFENLGSPYVSFRNQMGYNYIFNIVSDGAVELQRMGFNMLQRKWAQLALNQYIPVLRCIFNKNTECIEKMVVELDFFYKKRITTEACDTGKIAESFSDQFTDQAFMLSQPMAFTFKEKNVVFSALVKEITVLNLTNLQKGTASSNPAERGILTANSILIFEKSEESALVLTGKNKGTSVHQSVIAPDWDFNKMGIGGLDKEFSTIFRRAFASRVFPPDVVEHLGVRHVKGIMLFGPPGTGKTLMARQIGKMLNAKEPKIVNGPQILDKYVGESEANIRKLFADAEEEEKQKGRNSKLHIIIFDEIDAICKSRGSVGGGTGVHDTVVNQLLTKIDGVEQLNNILVIGMTNRRDLIDEALLRPGRLEVQMEIGLPDEKGRVEILRIHTATMKSFKRLCSGVSLEQLSTLTKNFSGAELEGLVRAATSNAMNRLIKASENVEIAEDATEKLKVTMSDFISGLDDITPAFGRSDDHFLEYIPNGIIEWGDPVSRVINDGFLLISQVKNSGKTPLLTLLLEGPANSGKTALAVKLMMDSDLPFVKVCSPENMIGYSETMKIHSIKKVFDDAYKSPLSCVILDDIERLIDYVPIGPRFSNSVVQAILVLLKKSPPKGKRLMVIGTSSLKDVLQDLGMLNAFTTVKHVFNVSESQQLITVLKTLDVFSSSELEVISEKTKGKRLCVGIKMLLMLAEFVRQVPSEERVQRLISLLVEEGIMEEEFSTIWH